jgi:hypothetical protein
MSMNGVSEILFKVNFVGRNDLYIENPKDEADDQHKLKHGKIKKIF